MTDEELDELVKKEIPKDLLSDEEFEYACHMYWIDAVKYINNATNLGLKLSKTYFDMYIDNKYSVPNGKRNNQNNQAQ